MLITWIVHECEFTFHHLCEMWNYVHAQSYELSVNVISRFTQMVKRKIMFTFNSRNFFLFPELPSTILLDVLELCLSWDHFRCHHNPTECLALELWRVFYHDKLTDIHISHHAFAFPKTTNYPDIVTNVQRLLEMLRESPLDQTWVSYTVWKFSVFPAPSLILREINFGW